MEVTDLEKTVDGYTEAELLEAKRSIESTLNKCIKVIEKLKEDTSQHTLTKRRIDAFKIAINLIDLTLSKE